MATEYCTPSVRIYNSGWTNKGTATDWYGYTGFGTANRGLEISFTPTKSTTSQFHILVPQCVSASAGSHTWYYRVTDSQKSTKPQSVTGNVASGSASVYSNVNSYTNAQFQFSVSGITAGKTYYVYLYSEAFSSGVGYIANHTSYDTIECRNYYTESSSGDDDDDDTTTTTYYYRTYDVTNSTYINSSSTSFTSSSVTRPSLSGYTYAGYIYHSSWSSAVSQAQNQNYDGTSTSCSSHSSTYPYVLFCYTKNSSSSSTSWSWSSSYSSTYTASTSFSFSLSAGKIGYCMFKAPSNGTLQVYTTGSTDTYGWLVDSGSINSSTGSGSNVISADTVYAQDDDSGDSSNFSLSYDVTNGTTYEIDWHNYSVSTAASGTLYITFTPAVTYYYAKVSYNANGGSGAPSAQTASDTDTSVSITLSSTKPTRSGYNFLGWSTSSTATSATYSAGGTYNFTGSTSTKTTTLYAVWQQITYTATVIYNANGGSGAPSSQSATETDSSVSITLSSTKPTRDRYNFLGWGTSASATSASYQPGTAYNFTGSTSGTTTTLYAVWENKFGADNIYYGLNGEWKLCEIYYGVNGTWVPLKTYYGNSGSWKNNT